MLSKLVRTGITAMVAAGGVVAVTSPAQAAAPRCVIGTWKLVKQELRQTGKESEGKFAGKSYDWRVTGGAGVRMKISSTKARFDFSKAAKERMVNSWSDGAVYRTDVTRRKVITMKSRLAGSGRHSNVQLFPKTSTGNATDHTIRTSPEYKDYGTVDLVKWLRKGNFDPFLRQGAMYYTCKGGKLTFDTRWKTDGGKGSHLLVYRRV